jgi:hypothetical protein
MTLLPEPNLVWISPTGVSPNYTTQQSPFEGLWPSPASVHPMYPHKSYVSAPPPGKSPKYPQMSGNGSRGSSGAYSRMRYSRPQSWISILPEHILLRLLGLCDDVTLGETALVSRYWLIASRKVAYASYTIQTTADYRLLLLLLQSPGSSIRVDYIKRLNFSFVSDESNAPQGGHGHPARRAAPSHVSVNEIYGLIMQLNNIESLRADWVGSRGSSGIPKIGPAVSSSGNLAVLMHPQQPMPSFLMVPQILHRLRHLEIRGGSWPFESLLQALVYTSQLKSLSMENIYEPNNTMGSPIATLPPHMPAFQLSRLSFGRCTLSGESIGWIISSSRHSLRHLTVNSIRRTPGSSGTGSFSAVLSMVGPALETLRVRNYLELPRWDAESLAKAGLGYCSNLKTLVIWCDVPPHSGGGGGPYSAMSVGSTQGWGPMAESESANALRFSPSPRTAYRTGEFPSGGSRGSSASQHFQYSPPHSHYPSTSSTTGSLHNTYIVPSPHAPPFANELGYAFLPGSSPSPSDYHSSTSSPTAPLPGSLLPILVKVIQKGWLPRLRRLVVPTGQIELCPSLVECQTELLIRSITLDDNWAIEE